MMSCKDRRQLLYPHDRLKCISALTVLRYIAASILCEFVRKDNEKHWSGRRCLADLRTRSSYARAPFWRLCQDLIQRAEQRQCVFVCGLSNEISTYQKQEHEHVSQVEKQ